MTTTVELMVGVALKQRVAAMAYAQLLLLLILVVSMAKVVLPVMAGEVAVFTLQECLQL